MGKRIFGAGLVLMLGVLYSGCGGSSSSGGGMSQQDATTFIQQLATASVGAAQSAISVQARSAREAEARKDSGGVQCMGQSPNITCTFNEQETFTETCQTGGNMQDNGTLTGSMNEQGTGYLSFSDTTTITDWSCDGNYVVNGDPYVQLNSTFSYLNGSPATVQTMTLSGGFKWGTSANETCQLNITVNFNGNSGAGDISGTACGYPINSSF
jgi:hypothetical protein